MVIPAIKQRVIVPSFITYKIKTSLPFKLQTPQSSLKNESIKASPRKKKIRDKFHPRLANNNNKTNRPFRSIKIKKQVRIT